MDFVHIADTIECINYWTGLILHLSLAYLILTAIRADVGAYKYLQVIFVANDITYATYCYVMKEKMITKGHAFAMFLTKPYGNNLHLVCVYGALFSLILVIVSFNFLYRYWAVANPIRIHLFSTVWFPLFLTFLASFEFAVWYAACYFLYAATDEARLDLAPEFARKYGIDAMTHAIVLGEYWRDGHFNVLPMSGIAIFFTIISSGVSFMVFCTVSILRFLSQSKTISAKTKRLQYALFRSLFVQAIIPFGFLHTNAGIALYAPVFGIDVGFYCDWISTSCSCFAPFDSLATILLFRDYREAAWTFLTCRKLRVRLGKIRGHVAHRYRKSRANFFLATNKGSHHQMAMLMKNS